MGSVVLSFYTFCVDAIDANQVRVLVVLAEVNELVDGNPVLEALVFEKLTH